MGKIKEEYVFDELDFNKYVEYCKNSPHYYPTVPFKNDFNLDTKIDRILILSFRISFYSAFVPEIGWATLFISALLKGVRIDFDDSIALMLCFMSLFLLIQLADLKSIKEVKEYSTNKILTEEQEYNKKYDSWISDVKQEYIKLKKKEYKDYKKYEKAHPAKILVEKYWMPSWIYFVIRISDNIVRYVGQTINEKGRESDHYRKNYPRDSFRFELIEKKDVDEIDAREKFWIKLFGRRNLDNKNSGGSGIKNRKGFNRKVIPYEEPSLEEIRKVQKWMNFLTNKNKTKKNGEK